MKIKFVKQDLWVGLYWKKETDTSTNKVKTTWYLCIIPMLPIIWSTVK